MNSFKPNKEQYLIGTWEDGEFWCRGEYSSKEAAQANYILLCQFHPEKHIELIHQVTTHKGLDYHHPKSSENLTTAVDLQLNCSKLNSD